MRVKAAGKNATMVLLNAGASSVRVLDALNIRRHVLGDAGPVATRAVATTSESPRVRASARGPRIRASAAGPRIRASAGGTTRRSHKHVTVTRHRRHR
jgi:D-alanyl-D-alanine carboxypeptidase/D-alanyl-D-alanine endopeptidase (penicillin-binding protein 7)